MKEHLINLIIEHQAEGKTFIDLRKPFEEQEYRVSFAFDPVPHFTVSTSKNVKPLQSFMIINKKYVETDDNDVILDNLVLTQTI